MVRQGSPASPCVWATHMFSTFVFLGFLDTISLYILLTPDFARPHGCRWVLLVGKTEVVSLGTNMSFDLDSGTLP